MTPLRRKLIALWTFTAAACVAMAFHQILLGYILLLIGMSLRWSVPQLVLSKKMQLLMLGAVVLANIAFWTRNVPVLPIVLWAMCAAVFARLFVLGVRWDARLFHGSATARPST